MIKREGEGAAIKQITIYIKILLNPVKASLEVLSRDNCIAYIIASFICLDKKVEFHKKGKF